MTSIKTSTHRLISSDISVIIPAFNVAKYIGSALESVLAQEPRFRQIIVVDDGSTDGTRNVVCSYDDPRIVYHYQTNMGLGPARNAGIELAESEYLYFMDGDDVLRDDMARVICATIDCQREAPDAVFFSASDFDDATGERLGTSSYFRWRAPGRYERGRDALNAALRSRSFPVCAPLFVFRRRVIDRAPRLRFRSILHEDEVFTPLLLLRSGFTIISNEPLYYRRVRPGSIMMTRARYENVTGVLEAAKMWLALSKSAHGISARLYWRQSQYCYSLAILHGARSGLPHRTVKRAVREVCPSFLHTTGLDLFLSRFSRRVAFRFINARARVLVYVLGIS